MYRKIILLLFCAVSLVSTAQEKKKKLDYYGFIKEAGTNDDLKYVEVSLLRADSSVIEKKMTETVSSTTNNAEYDISMYKFFVEPGDYLIRFVKEGYETLYVPFNYTGENKRQSYIEAPLVYMKKLREYSLDEVSVVATKLKVYYRGDTIVYNADAFITPEGSTIDALIKQLPGVELKSDGQIFVNGRYVESLLLNGKDFFADNKVMLHNLGTYTVKNIEVYEKLGDRSVFLGRDAGDKQFVMDVKLKKEYNQGWIANIDLGGTANGMYLARLFVMRQTDASRLAITGNMNNLNDYQAVTASDWTPDKMPTGRLYTKSLTAQLNINDKRERFRSVSQASYTRYDNHQGDYTYRTNFLSTGDTYERIFGTQKYCNQRVNASEIITINPTGKYGWAGVTIGINGDYSHRKARTTTISGMSAESLDGYGKELRDSLMQGVLTTELRRKLTNRVMNNSLSYTEEWKLEPSLMVKTKMKNSDDSFFFTASANIGNRSRDGYTQYQIDYKPFSGTADSYFQNQYSRLSGNANITLDAFACYHYAISHNSSVELQYQPLIKRIDNKNDLYRLDQLTAWGYGTSESLGSLPSEAEYLSTRSAGNSYHERFRDDRHRINVYVNWDIIKQENHRLVFETNFPVNIYDQHMRYERGSINVSHYRTKTAFLPSASLYSFSNNNRRRIGMSYGVGNTLPNMLYELGYTDDTDPLNIYKYTASGLKPAKKHSLKAVYADKTGSVAKNMEIRYNSTLNAIAMGYQYDTHTGVRTYQPENVNGNWDMSANINFSGNADKAKRWWFTSGTSWSYINSVDLISTTLDTSTSESEVRTSNLSERLTLSRNLGKWSVNANASFSWIHSESTRKGFKTLDAFNINYGLNANGQLPWKFSLSADLSCYTRSGYEYTSMNGTDIVWNMRLSRPICKGRIVLMADAFDIFQQLEKTERYVNAQGRVEKFYNPMKRYVLFHAVFKLDTWTKKK